MLFPPLRGSLRRCAHHALTRACRSARTWSAAAFTTFVLLASGPRAIAAAIPGDDFFPIGVWSQPHIYFDKWQARGINTLMRYENYGGAAGHDIDSWIREANKRGLYQIRQPRANISLDKNESRLLAWMHEDEPDFRNKDPQEIINSYNALKAADPSRPVLVNFSGGNVLSGATSKSKYDQYLKGADWVSQDMYPVTGWDRPDWIDNSIAGNDRRTAGKATQQLAQWSGGKKQFAILETGDQQLSWVPGARGVNADEFRGQVWESIINGAQGIVYFPFQIGSGFRFDNTPQSIVEEMTEQNARIQSMARILNSSKTPYKDKLDLGDDLLEAARRKYDGDEYFFVLNMSSKTLDNYEVDLPGLDKLKYVGALDEKRRLNLTGGALLDDFGPWELHVYHADLVGAGVLPEPGSILTLSGLLVALLIRRRR